MHFNDQRGFTLIELLVVVGIIGVLAGIALPAFLGQSQKGQDSAAKSDVNTAVKAIEEFQTVNGTYAATPAELEAIHSSLAGATGLAVAGNANSYTVSVGSASGTTFSIARTAGGLVRDCSDHGTGGCSAAADAHGSYW